MLLHTSWSFIVPLLSLALSDTAYFNPLAVFICDWIWENPPVTHKDNYLEKRNWIIQSVISPEGLKLQACNLQRSYSYSRSIRLSYLQCTASWISCHFRWFFINTTSSYIGVEGGGWRGATKWRVTAELCTFQGEMVHKEAPLHSNCHKT